jgi:acyl carrier protein
MTERQVASGEMLALIRSTFREVIERPLGELNLDTSIADLGIDSVSVAEIVFRIEDALGIEVPTAEWVRIRTLVDFVDVVDRARRQ